MEINLTQTVLNDELLNTPTDDVRYMYTNNNNNIYIIFNNLSDTRL